MSLSRILQRKEDKKKTSEVLDNKDNKIETHEVEDLLMEKLVSALLESKLKEQNTEVQIPEMEPQIQAPPKLTRQRNVTMVDDPESDQKNFIFVSDTNMTPEIKEQMNSYTNIRPYSDNFINRSPLHLLQAGIEHIWINISNKKARQWLQLNLKRCLAYTRVLVWTSSKRAKFLVDLRPHIDIETRACNLSKLSALSLDQLMQKVEDRIDIHSVPNKCMAFLGCSKQVSKKKIEKLR